MNRKNTLIGIAIIFFILTFGIIFLLFLQKSAQNSQQALIQPSPPVKLIFATPTLSPAITGVFNGLSPTDIANNFYSWYISYPGSPVTSGAYMTSSYLADTYKTRISNLMSRSTDPKYDPIFCPANRFSDFVASKAYYDNSQTNATVYILKYNGDGPSIYKITLENVENRWLISDINCVQ